MELYTQITFPAPSFTFSHLDRIILLGSCFTENIGKQLKENKFNTDINPFGILYNPASVSSAVRLLIRPEKYTRNDLFQHEGVYYSFSHHSRFSALSEEETLSNINTRLEKSAEELKQVTRLVITWGTAYVYLLKKDGSVVANCHKLPEEMFERKMLTTDEIIADWKELLYSLWEHNPKIKILFTISPVRHWKDGAHQNQLSKATLLLAADHLKKSFPDRISYFPGYEIMMDELRDYRFYADDMLHPSPLAIEYIWKCFVENQLSPESQSILKEWKEIIKAINHKPFQPESEAYKRFINQTLLKMEQLHRKFPFFDMENERLTLQDKLK